MPSIKRSEFKRKIRQFFNDPEDKNLIRLFHLKNVKLLNQKLKYAYWQAKKDTIINKRNEIKKILELPDQYDKTLLSILNIIYEENGPFLADMKDLYVKWNLLVGDKKYSSKIYNLIELDLAA